MRFIERILNRSPLRTWAEEQHRGRLKVLVYHEVDHPEQFDRQIRWIKDSFDVLSVEEVEQGLSNSFERYTNPLLISFDDARPSVYEKGSPILEKYQLPSVVFVITSLVGTKRPYWWDEVKYYAANPNEANSLMSTLKKIPDVERRSILRDLRSAYSGDSLSFVQLDWDQLKEMEASGMCVANHTHSHPMLDQCDPDTIRREINQGMELLENHGMSGVSYLAYPNGHVNETVRRVLEKLGINLAFGFNHRVNGDVIDPLHIARLSVHSNTSLDKLQLICSGLHSKLLPIRIMISNATGR